MDKVIDIEERIPSMRERRRRKTNRKFLFILAVFVIALLVILYFRSSFSRINEIQIIGATLHETTFYEKESGLELGEFLWGFSAKDIEKELLSMDSVKDVNVSRKWVRDVEITVTEWQTLAYVENAGRYQALLESGEVFSEEIIVPEDKAPIISGFANEKIKKRMTKQLLKMNQDVYALISEIIYTGSEIDENNITVYMDDGYEIHAVIPTFSEKMDYYEDIIAQLSDHEKGVIDMEVGTFFTPFSKKYGTNEEAIDIEGDEVEEEEAEESE